MDSGRVFLFVMLTFFAILIIGTFLKWKILVDPPEEWSKFYSHSFLNSIFGSDFLIWFNYIVGIVGFCFSLYMILTT